MSTYDSMIIVDNLSQDSKLSLVSAGEEAPIVLSSDNDANDEYILPTRHYTRDHKVSGSGNELHQA